jgi:plastocyanin
VARVLSDAYRSGETRGAAGGGLVFYPHARGMPVSLSGDAVTLLDRDADAGERVAWSVALNVGISFTTHTLSLFATNTPSASLQARTRGDGRTRWGVALTAPIAAGRLLGLVAPRERGLRSVAADADAAPPLIHADIYRYAYPQQRLEVARGTTIEWTNRDAVVHTVSADDGSWDSGAIQPGERWRARFDEPGIYPFHCGPHPFMKGTVVVR